jgi:hypothetical protein
MDHLIQERCINALTIAIGPRYKLRSSVCLAEDLEDLILVEAARSVGVGSDVLSRLPQQIISKRGDILAAYHLILEALLFQLGLAELNSAEWWARVNSAARAPLAAGGGSSSAVNVQGVAGGAGAEQQGGPGMLSVEAFFEHYRPRGGDTWEALARRSGGLDKYRCPATAANPAGLSFTFPSPEVPASVEDYLLVYCGSGPWADGVAQRVVLAVHQAAGLDAEPLLPCLASLRVATQEAEAAKMKGAFVPPPSQAMLKSKAKGLGAGVGGSGPPVGAAKGRKKRKAARHRGGGIKRLTGFARQPYAPHAAALQAASAPLMGGFGGLALGGFAAAPLAAAPPPTSASQSAAPPPPPPF